MSSFHLVNYKKNYLRYFFALLLFLVVLIPFVFHDSPLVEFGQVLQNSKSLYIQENVVIQNNLKDSLPSTFVTLLKQRLKEGCLFLSWFTKKKRNLVQQAASKVEELIWKHSHNHLKSIEKTSTSTSSRNVSVKKHSLTPNILSTGFLKDKRTALTCISPEIITKFFKQKELKIVGERCENEISRIASLEPVEGMILTIDSTQHVSTTSPGNKHKIIQYELRERIQHKLGLVDTHKVDFAYTPAHSFSDQYNYHHYQRRKKGKPKQTHDLLIPISSTTEYLTSVPFHWISTAAKNIWYRKESKPPKNKDAKYIGNNWLSSPQKENIPQLEMKSNNLQETESSAVQRNRLESDRIRSINHKMVSSNVIASMQQLQEAKIFVQTLSIENSPWEFDSNDHRNSNDDIRESSYTKMGERAFAGGAQGEVWRARRKCPEHESLHTCDKSQKLIMKRLKVEHGKEFLEGGLREVYFGGLLAQHQNSSALFTKYIDHFFRKQTSPLSNSFVSQQELWIVFEDSGPSLRSYLYTPVSSGDFFIYEHSAFWRKLRMGVYKSARKKSSSSIIAFSGPSSPDDHNYHQSSRQDPENQESDEAENTSIFEGRELMKEVLRQLLTSAAILHEQGIIHRDIKPSNIMCYIYDISTIQNLENIKDHKSVNCVLGDFSSAWEKDISSTMYMNGPSAAEQTDEYAPPEVLFGPRWIPFDENVPTSYDSWSIGVVVLEMLLGTPHVFSVDQRTTMILSHRLQKEGASSEDIRRALYLAGLSQFCLYVPVNSEEKKWPLRNGDPLHKTAIVKPTCTIEDFHNALRARDPLGLGFDSSSDSLLDLIWGLLAWDPSKRITPAQALNHYYFHPQNHKFPGRIKNSVGEVEDELHALNPQVLDPNISAKVDKHQTSEFVCPKCGKSFHDWNSCHVHARKRRHALFCDYDRQNLPPCLNAHSMLPAHPTSGYCDIQGRRATIEDFHAIHLHQNHQFYGVFDGHWGNLASKYSARYMHASIEKIWSDLDERVLNTGDWKDTVTKDLDDAFKDLHRGFLSAVEKSPGKVMNKSGSTATILLTTTEAVVVANVGDSRAILSNGASYSMMSPTPSAIQLTVDHIASNNDEKSLIEQKGGYISSTGSIDRVNGTLAVTRSIGDVPMMEILSQSPHVWLMAKKDIQTMCRGQFAPNDTPGKEEQVNMGDPDMPCFAVLASDGLWDVMSNQEVVEMVVDVLRRYHFDESEIPWEEGGEFQLAAQKLTQEAYVRGSTDNIGVCVVAIT